MVIPLKYHGITLWHMQGLCFPPQIRRLGGSPARANAEMTSALANTPHRAERAN